MLIVVVVISDLYLFQEIVLLNPYFIFSKNLILLLTHKVTLEHKAFRYLFEMLLHFFFLDPTPGTGGVALGLPAIADFIDLSNNTQDFDHVRSSSMLQLINGKSRNLQKLLKYFNGKTTSASDILSLFGVLPISFVLYLKDLLVIVLLLFMLSQAALFSFASSFT